MRLPTLLATFVLLVVSLGALWAFRFERIEGLPTWRLTDLKPSLPAIRGVDWTGDGTNPSVNLSRKAGEDPVSVCLAIPGMPPVEGLHLRFRLSARKLHPGEEKWQDGRFVIEWRTPAGGSEPEQSPAGSIRYSWRNKPENFVILPDMGTGVPFIRLEHLGRSGEFTLSDLELVAVRESALWSWGRWIAAAAWLAWCYALVRSWPDVSRWRAAASSALWVLMGIQMVIPGPWKLVRPIYPEFRIGSENMSSRESPRTPAAALPRSLAEAGTGPVPALGEFPQQGSWALRIKLSVKKARPLLHGLLLLAPSLALLFLAGRKPALLLMVGMALAIELGQVAFGYGFGWDDVGDLACDAAGIILALWLFGKFGRQKRSTPKRHEMKVEPP